LQVLGEELVRGGGPYDASALKQALQDHLFSRTGRLALVFERRYQQIVGRSSYLAAVLGALARAGEGGTRLTDVGREVGAPSGDTARYLERLGDAVVQREDGGYALQDRVFGLWLAWRQPAGSVVPMRLVGDEAELRTAEHLSRLGFDLVYQSRASRGAFDLLALRGASQVGVQVKRRALPLVFSREEWARMEAEAARQGWDWVLAAVDVEGTVRILDPAGARIGKTVRAPASAMIDNLLAWVDRKDRTG
ncbi:MAG: hypothetical protein KDA28_13910, partial [Phycisphaerales bacterium]|nr:hypothetical protein [Phycisphaerales bacterium]